MSNKKTADIGGKFTNEKNDKSLDDILKILNSLEKIKLSNNMTIDNVSKISVKKEAKEVKKEKKSKRPLVKSNPKLKLYLNGKLNKTLFSKLSEEQLRDIVLRIGPSDIEVRQYPDDDPAQIDEFEDLDLSYPKKNPNEEDKESDILNWIENLGKEKEKTKDKEKRRKRRDISMSDRKRIRYLERKIRNDTRNDQKAIEKWQDEIDVLKFDI